MWVEWVWKLEVPFRLQTSCHNSSNPTTMLTRTNSLLIRLNILDSANANAKIAGFQVRMLNLGMLLIHQKVKTESVLIKICH